MSIEQTNQDSTAPLLFFVDMHPTLHGNKKFAGHVSFSCTASLTATIHIMWLTSGHGPLDKDHYIPVLFIPFLRVDFLLFSSRCRRSEPAAFVPEAR
ncbi:hypothetical protein ACN38_g2503 [Penicillium nordicum]|uniref:Uncharacterized protein n=1 Tax=Penicillium nordicum TaxID=229535 RepID=A0A0M9WIW2_9EURO|nr:hypothetical protein ACN38_g2503 [Penicillium nordicum]